MSARYHPKLVTYVYSFNPLYNAIMDNITILHFTEWNTDQFDLSLVTGGPRTISRKVMKEKSNKSI